MDQKLIKEKIGKLDNFVKKFPSEKELIPSEISELMNIILNKMILIIYYFFKK